MSTILQDLRYGCRMLQRSPGFTAVVVVVLALGIGANSTIFSMINAVLLRPLPFRDAASLYELSDVNGRGESMGVRLAELQAFQQRTHVSEGLAVWYPLVLTLTGPEGPENLYGFQVSSDWFDMLGTPPAAGRLFHADEFRPGAPGVVILSDRLWQRRFGRDPNILGRQIVMNGQGYTVVGVMAPDFVFGHPVFELWTAWQLPGGLTGGPDTRWISMVRLRPGVSWQQAQAEVDRVFGGGPGHHATGFRTTLRPLGKHRAAQVSSTLLLLLGAVGFVLLIACLNVANLLLARGAGREREIAVRAALGAGRFRVVRQLLTENLLLAVVGGLAGLGVAASGGRILAAFFPERIPVPGLEQTRMDAQVLLFTLGLGLLTGVACGLAPALQASRTNLNDALKEAGRSASGGFRSQRLRNLLVIAETALSLVLLAGAGLMLRSVDRMLRVPLGFSPDRLLTLRVPVPPSIKEGPQQARYVGRMLAGIRSLPGLNAVGMTTILPMGDVDSQSVFAIAGRQFPRGEEPSARLRSVDAGYFRAMGIALLSGRVFDESDGASAPPVAVINQTLARRYFPNEDPMGQRIAIHGASSREPALTIVGVVNDVKHGSVTDVWVPEVYRDYRQSLAPAFSTTLIVRTNSGDPMRVAATVQKAIRAANPDQPVRYLRSMRQVIAESMAQPRFYTLLLGLFAAIALVLAASGLYGVLSYSVGRRAREIGIRMALGASKQAIVRQVVGQALVLAAIGIAVGLAGAFALTRLLASLLYQVAPTDPLTFASVSTALILVALAASYVPARRAMAVDPTTALRCE